MLVMDADSIMSGEAIVRLAAIMEARPSIGILQTVPGGIGRDSFLARVQQLASRLYGPMLGAGLHFWLLGDAQFWGHNALIRLEPFMRHCALPRLPGRPPLGGEIISHDFVESGLMRRAGYGVWLAYDLAGSHEELPPNLLAELVRERRWCKGNLQHLKLIFSRRFIPAHRFLFLVGVMAYGSALLWLLFLILSSAEAVIEAVTPPIYFSPARSLFPAWPVWEPWWALSLLLTTGVLLFFPKVCAVALVLVKGRRKLFGGFWRLLAGVGLEVLTSSLLAPIRMQFHSKFVLFTLLGSETGWETQEREGKATSWRQAVRFHLGGTLLAAVWGSVLFVFNRPFFWWVSPIFIPLFLSIPLSVVTSLPALGRGLRRLGLLAVPEEIDPPPELVETQRFFGANRERDRPLDIPKGQGVALAVVDPAACGRRLGLSCPTRRHGPKAAAARQALVEKALAVGPAGLSRAEKTRLLTDGQALAAVHRRVWLLPEADLRRLWLARLC